MTQRVTLLRSTGSVPVAAFPKAEVRLLDHAGLNAVGSLSPAGVVAWGATTTIVALPAGG